MDDLQVNLVEWLKTMVSDRNSEAVLDPNIAEKPSSKVLKRALLVALKCVDPDAQKRPKMGHVIHMLEMDDLLFRDVSKSFLENAILFTIKKKRKENTILFSSFFIGLRTPNSIR